MKYFFIARNSTYADLSQFIFISIFLIKFKQIYMYANYHRYRMFLLYLEKWILIQNIFPAKFRCMLFIQQQPSIYQKNIFSDVAMNLYLIWYWFWMINQMRVKQNFIEGKRKRFSVIFASLIFWLMSFLCHLYVIWYFCHE